MNSLPVCLMRLVVVCLGVFMMPLGIAMLPAPAGLYQSVEEGFIEEASSISRLSSTVGRQAAVILDEQAGHCNRVLRWSSQLLVSAPPGLYQSVEDSLAEEPSASRLPPEARRQIALTFDQASYHNGIPGWGWDILSVPDWYTGGQVPENYCSQSYYSGSHRWRPRPDKLR